MRTLAVLSGLLCAAGLLAARRAAADESYTVAVVVDPARKPLVARLRAELIGLGFLVEEVQSDPADDLPDEDADKHRIAVVRIDEPTQAIEFRLLVSSEGARQRERVPLRAGRSDVSAVAAVELLRARLIKLGVLRAPAVVPEPAPVKTPPKAVVPSWPILSADASAGAWYSAGGIAVSPAVVLGLRARPRRSLAIGAFSAFQPGGSDIRSVEGTAHSQATLVGVITDFGFGSERTRFELGGGVALSVLSLSGSAVDPFAGRVTHSYGVAPMLRSSLTLTLVGPLSLRTEIAAGVSNPRVLVRFADRTVAHWGRPLALAGIGLEIALW